MGELLRLWRVLQPLKANRGFPEPLWFLKEKEECVKIRFEYANRSARMSYHS